jgi:hypothetical protein
MTGPYGADIDPGPSRCGNCGHGGQVHLRVKGEGSVVCYLCPHLWCQPPGALPGTLLAGRDEGEQDEIDRLIGRLQRLLGDWHRDRR